MNIGNGGYTQAADPSGPFAGFDKKLFKGDEDLLSQDFQTAAEPGQNRYNTFSSVYPVMKVSLSNNMGDGPSIDSMVAASKEFVNKMDEQNYYRVRTMFAEKIDYADSKQMKRYADNEKVNKERDLRMKHGKKWKDFTRDALAARDREKNRLRPGEVKRYDKKLGKYVSNKD
tara:strand:+ start:1889 stop:2404 length:516 start_codon:yes stop_codon:yes gene_type:complete